MFKEKVNPFYELANYDCLGYKQSLSIILERNQIGPIPSL